MSIWKYGFEIMKKIAENEKFDKIVIVSGDGDYIKLVKYLIEKDLLKKILFQPINTLLYIIR